MSEYFLNIVFLKYLIHLLYKKYVELFPEKNGKTNPNKKRNNKRASLREIARARARVYGIYLCLILIAKLYTIFTSN